MFTTYTPPFTTYSPPEVRILKSAKVQAFNGPIVAPPPHGFQGGIVLGSSLQEQKLRHSRYGVPVDYCNSAIDDYEKVPGEYTYFGPFYNHFGHTMSEFVHRAIPSIILGSFKKFLLISYNGAKNLSYESFPDFYKEILKFLGIEPSNILVITNHSEVENLFICEQGSDFGGGPKEGYLNFLDTFTKHRLDSLIGPTSPVLRTYVSRSKLLHGGNFLGERYLEYLLEGEGYTIMHPQELSLTAQMQLYRSSNVLIFPEGSACHGLEFFGNSALEECHLLERRKNHRNVFEPIFRNRAKVTSILADAHCLGSCILNPSTNDTLDHFANAFIPSDILLRYFRQKNLAQLNNFSVKIYNDNILADFDRHIDYHRNNNSCMIDQELIQTYRLMLDRELARI